MFKWLLLEYFMPLLRTGHFNKDRVTLRTGYIIITSLHVQFELNREITVKFQKHFMVQPNRGGTFPIYSTYFLECIIIHTKKRSIFATFKI